MICFVVKVMYFKPLILYFQISTPVNDKAIVFKVTHTPHFLVSQLRSQGNISASHLFPLVTFDPEEGEGTKDGAAQLHGDPKSFCIS